MKIGIFDLCTRYISIPMARNACALPTQTSTWTYDMKLPHTASEHWCSWARIKLLQLALACRISGTASFMVSHIWEILVGDERGIFWTQSVSLSLSHIRTPGPTEQVPRPICVPPAASKKPQSRAWRQAFCPSILWTWACLSAAIVRNRLDPYYQPSFLWRKTI